MAKPEMPSTGRVRAGPSPIHGTGCFAASAFAPGDFIGTFTGPEVAEDGSHVLWATHDGRHWEGRLGTSVLRFLNHSRTPNVEFDGPELYAVRDIAPGEELLFDYGEDWADVP